jgi:hypothetical protein
MSMKSISACPLLLTAALAVSAPALAGNAGMLRGTAVLEVSPGTYRIFVDDSRYYSFCERVTVAADQTTSTDVFVGSRSGLYSEHCNQHFDLVRPGISADVYDIF